MLQQMQNTGNTADAQRRKDLRDSERRRASQTGGVAPPSPALVRHGSKQRNVPSALQPGGGHIPGQITPSSAAAHVGVAVGTPPHRRGSQQPSGHHPYAGGSNALDYGHGRAGTADDSLAAQYGRQSPMVSTVNAAPPIHSNVRARGGDIGVTNGGEYAGQDGQEPAPKSSLWRILTCRCG